ncbi:hypothetical protein SDC9_178564 [bioreactor metagenome]|uniref:Uncharacterized protein n=1 Tax=bioreactor metagenome TaxID=1076179 RepID=A0A645GXI9_9ZZZZ
MVDILSLSLLHHSSCMHDDDAVCNGKGFLLVVGDVDGSDAGFIMDSANLFAQVLSQLCIEG